jgi:DNA-binding MarR family transcriptional regulator
VADLQDTRTSGTGIVNEQHSTVCSSGEPQEAPWMTLVGLVFETADGLRRALVPGVESELGLGGLAFEVLVRLARTPGARLRMTDLAAQTGLTPGGLTRVVDRLAEAGLVCREACDGDRRGLFTALTPTGQARTAEVLRHHEREVETLTAGTLDGVDTETLISLLRRLRDRVHPQAARVTDDPEVPGTAPPR